MVTGSMLSLGNEKKNRKADALQMAAAGKNSKIQILHQDVAKTAIVFILKIKSWGNKKIYIHQICIRDKSIYV